MITLNQELSNDEFIELQNALKSYNDFRNDTIDELITDKYSRDSLTKIAVKFAALKSLLVKLNIHTDENGYSCHDTRDD